MTFTRQISKAGREISTCDDCRTSVLSITEARHTCPRDAAGTVWRISFDRTDPNGGPYGTETKTCTRCGEERPRKARLDDHNCGPAKWAGFEEDLAEALEDWAWEGRKALVLASIEEMRERFQGAATAYPFEAERLAYTQALIDAAEILNKNLGGSGND